MPAFQSLSSLRARPARPSRSVLWAALTLVLGLCGVVPAPPASAVEAAAPIVVGAIVVRHGTYRHAGEDGMRGVALALEEVGWRVGGRRVMLISAGSDATPEGARRAALKLIERHGVRIIIGPLSGDEGLALRSLAHDHPEVTFVNGASASQDTTLREVAPNFFRFNGDGVQWMAGLAEHVLNERGWRSVAIIGHDYSFPYAQVAGFVWPFCQLGGRIDVRLWVPLETRDYTSTIAQLPSDVDAIFVAMGGSDAVDFITQYQRAGGDLPLIGGSTFVDQTTLALSGPARTLMIGVPSAGPISDEWDDPRWQAFKDRYAFGNPAGLATPSIFAFSYYVNTKALLAALEAVGGDVSDGGARLREALGFLRLETPAGPIHLDHNRQAVVPVFLTEVVEDAQGHLVNRLVKITPAVTQSLGMDPAQFLRLGRPTRDHPDC